MKVIDVIKERCIGCRICEQWCTWQHDESGGTLSRIHVKRLHEEYANLPLVCHQCEDTPCINSCKSNALSKDAVTGAILVDSVACTGCRLCIRNCPYTAITYDRVNRKVRICDLCGGNPQCVAHCPEYALDYVPREERGKKKEPSKGLWSTQEVVKGE